MSKLRIGLIGYGRWGTHYGRLLSQQDDQRKALHFVGAVDLKPERREAFRNKHPGTAIYEHMDHLLTEGRPEAVIIATPASTHSALVARCLTENLHVLCEKPLGMSKKMCVTLHEQAKRAQKVLMVDYTFLHHAHFQYLREQVHDETLGQIYHMQMLRTHAEPVRNDVNVITDLASHDIAMCHSLFNMPPEWVSAQAQQILPHPHVDIADLHLGYLHGARAHIHVSWLSPFKTRQMKITGSKQSALWNELNPETPVILKPQGQPDTQETPALKCPEPLKSVLDTFLESIENGTAVTDGLFAAQVARVLAAVEASLRQGGAKICLNDLC